MSVAVRLLAEPPRDCPLCPRLATSSPNGGSASRPGSTRRCRPSCRRMRGRRLLIVGLAPGLRGANRTGRPFTGDYAGDLLYATLIAIRFRARQLRGAARRRARRSSTPRSPMRCAACRRRTNRRPPRSAPAGVPQRRRSPRCRDLQRDRWRSAASRIRSTVRALGAACRRYPFAHGAGMHAVGIDAFSTATTARATTPTPAADDGDVRRRCSPRAECLGDGRAERAPQSDRLRRRSPRQLRPQPRSLHAAGPSRSQSRCFSVSRLSCSFLPRATASSELGPALVVEIDLQRHHASCLRARRSAPSFAISRLLSSSLRRRRGSWLKRLACRYSGR